MYTIHIDGKLVYAPTLANAGYLVLNPKLKKQLNRADVLTFSIPDSNPSYADIKPMEGIVTAREDGRLIFYGRVAETKRNFYRQKEVYCEGGLAFLNDVVLRPYAEDLKSIAEWMSFYLTQYNAKVTDSRRRIIYSNTSDLSDEIIRSNSNFTTVWSEVKEKLLDEIEGYISFDFNSLQNCLVMYYKSTSGTEANQPIQFGRNLLDLTDYLDADTLYTDIVPLGEKDSDTEQYLTIASVNAGSDSLSDSTARTKYGRIEKVVEWEDVSVASILKNKAQAKLDAEAGKVQQSISISAIDLHLLDVNTQALKLGDYYRVISVPHGYTNAADNNLFPLTQYTLDMSNPDLSVYTFGKTRKTLTGG